MINSILVYDFETTSVDPHTCQPVQIAAVPINSRTLDIKSHEGFVSDIRPTDFDAIDRDNVKWHANNRKCTEEEILESWRKAPTIDVVMANFFKYVDKYNWKQNRWGAPIRAGHNIISYDDIILTRVSKELKLPGLNAFAPRDYIDTLNVAFMWFESLPEPKKYNMQDLREFFAFSEKAKAGAHDALQDCIDVAELTVRFLKLTRAVAPKVKFKGALNA